MIVLGLLILGVVIMSVATFIHWGGAIALFLGIILVIIGLAYLIYKPLPNR